MVEPAAIRPATRPDAPAISAAILEAIRVSNARDYPPAVIARVAAGFSPDGVRAMIAERRMLVAVVAGEVAGTGALDGAVVRSVFVRPAHQGSGVGKALMDAVFRLAEAEGLAQLSLRSSLTARGFYARLGFEAVREDLVGEERTIVMRKALGPALPVRRDV